MANETRTSTTDLGDHIACRVEYGAPEAIFVAGVGIQKILAGQKLLKVRRAHPGSLIGKELGAAGKGIDKVEQHGEQDKDAEYEQIGQHKEIGHAADADDPLQAHQRRARWATGKDLQSWTQPGRAILQRSCQVACVPARSWDETPYLGAQHDFASAQVMLHPATHEQLSSIRCEVAPVPGDGRNFAVGVI